MKKSFLTGIALIALIVYPSQVFAADTTTLQAQLMTYLPYILIGGAVILLISIVGILLSKKKEKNEEEVAPATATAVVPETPAVAFTPEVQAPVQPVNMDNISSNLYAPAETKPTIQETMESSTPPEELPIVQPEFVPSVAPVTAETQSSDLQAILQGEASVSPMGPVTDHVMEETPEADTPIPSFDAPAESSVPSFAPNPMPEVPTVPNTTPVETPAVPSFDTSTPEVTPATIPDLQQFVNNQVAEVPPMAAPMMETPAPVETPTPVDATTPTQTETPFSI